MSKRKKVSKTLREVISHTRSKEDIETAKYFHTLANKNDRGTLTLKEALNILDILGDYSNLTICSTEGGYWVEIYK